MNWLRRWPTGPPGIPSSSRRWCAIWPSEGCCTAIPGRIDWSATTADASVPATLQAAIGARIDRLGSTAKRTLNAAAVIGSQFNTEGLSALVDTVDLAPLIEAQLVEQVRFTPRAEYAFRHPLIRTVAYESQLKSDRAQLHRRLAAAIEDAGAVDENAALIAEHIEAAGDLHGAFNWHMRAGTWCESATCPPRRQVGSALGRSPTNFPERRSGSDVDADRATQLSCRQARFGQPVERHRHWLRRIA